MRFFLLALAALAAMPLVSKVISATPNSGTYEVENRLGVKVRLPSDSESSKTSFFAPINRNKAFAFPAATWAPTLV